jgi:cytochrome c-type protein NapB
MSELKPQTLRYPAFAMAILLMSTLAIIFGQSLRQSQQVAETSQQEHPQETDEKAVIRGEAGVFSGLHQESRFVDTDQAAVRNLNAYYARRAYPGAPPFIPHPVDQDMGTTFKVCSSCHAKGGYVPGLAAYAPLTPHPEYANCRQCHVSQADVPLFAETEWQALEPPVLGRSALPGGPPPMPHGLQMRENCSACHTGPASPPGIRTSHPERVYCRQCHVPAATDRSFSR